MKVRERQDMGKIEYYCLELMISIIEQILNHIIEGLSHTKKD